MRAAHKKLLSIITACCLLISTVALVVANIAQPTIAAPTGTGYGSNGKFLAPIDPPAVGSIPISTRAELEAIANNLGGTYHLTQDINLAGNEWVPIGDDVNPFFGTLDGQGCVYQQYENHWR